MENVTKPNDFSDKSQDTVIFQEYEELYNKLVKLPKNKITKKQLSELESLEYKLHLVDLEDEAVHLELRDQILLRPDTYIGAIDLISMPMEVLKKNKNGKSKIKKINMDFSKSFFKIFYEVFSNATDNVLRSRKKGVEPGDIIMDITNKSVLVYNEGMYIPIVEKTKITGETCWNPELIFANLLTSTNYDDEEERTWAGRNGYGAKLTNIFSKVFKIEVTDPARKLKYKQTFRKNLSVIEEPEITSYKDTQGYVRVYFEPDLKRFNMKEIDEDWMMLFEKCALDAAYSINVPIMFNDTPYFISSITKFAEFYVEGGLKKSDIIIEEDNIEIFLADTPYRGKHISFVNGINTPNGGVHVDLCLNKVAEPIFRKLLDKSKKKGEKKANANKKVKRTELGLNISDIRQHITVIVSCVVPNPQFNNQSKEILIKPTPKLNAPKKVFEKAASWQIVKTLQKLGEEKTLNKLKDREIKKVKNVKDIPKLDDANFAGTNKSLDCTLIITEGDSAKSFIMEGLKYWPESENYYGVFPIRGKFINTLKAKPDKILGNKEYEYLTKILGLKYGLDYSKTENYNKLRYGNMLIVTDADKDGHHIKGLLMNMINHHYQSVIPKGFIMSMRLDICIARLGKKMITFMFERELDKWVEEYPESHKWEIDYYKGLATYEDEDIKRLFSEPRLLVHTNDKHTHDYLTMAFDPTRSDDRKYWIADYKERLSENKLNEPRVDGEQTISEFMAEEFIEFSAEDLERSVPSMVDGLKPSQRKILYTVEDKNIKTKTKVQELAGTISAYTAYKHGQVSLEGAMICLAQDYPGSNNINMLVPCGRFGSEHEGGKDAGASRYIYTHIAPIFRKIFIDDDKLILKYMKEEGKKIEPHTYFPIIPMCLINGTNGIGTGWSSSIPKFNIYDVVEWIIGWITKYKSNEEEFTGYYPEDVLIPWYRDFNEPIIMDKKKNRAIIFGKFSKVTKKRGRSNQKAIFVEKLPIGLWTDTYNKYLDSMLERKEITDWDRGNKRGTFYIYGLKNPSMKNLKLFKNVSMSNLTAFDYNGIPTTYKDINELLNDWCSARLIKYEERREAKISDLEKKRDAASLRYKFIEEIIIKKTLKVNNRNKKDLAKELEEKGYPYDYMKMPMTKQTKQGLESLKKQMDKIQEEINYYEDTLPEDLWMNDLDELLKYCGRSLKYLDKKDVEYNSEQKKAIDRFMKLMEKREGKGKKNNKGKKDGDMDGSMDENTDEDIDENTDEDISDDSDDELINEEDILSEED